MRISLKMCERRDDLETWANQHNIQNCYFHHNAWGLWELFGEYPEAK